MLAGIPLPKISADGRVSVSFSLLLLQPQMLPNMMLLGDRGPHEQCGREVGGLRED